MEILLPVAVGAGVVGEGGGAPPAGDAVRDVFMKHHGDLLDAAFWQGHKERIVNGHVHDVFPYEPVKRFAHHAAATSGAG